MRESQISADGTALANLMLGGRVYRTPVLAFPLAGGYLTPLPYGTDTDGCRSLLEV